MRQLLRTLYSGKHFTIQASLERASSM